MSLGGRQSPVFLVEAEVGEILRLSAVRVQGPVLPLEVDTLLPMTLNVK